jgi:hypothetical protein
VKIYQYNLDPYAEGEQKLVLPKSAKLISLSTVYDQPTLWALVDPEEKETVDYSFRVCKVGDEISGEEMRYLRYIGVCVSTGSSHIWHVFQVVKPPPKEPEESGG